ncbi:MAG: TolC family protein [Balneolaceae bacterium]|nr:TolC family protein [Balneolaceae bacterium]
MIYTIIFVLLLPGQTAPPDSTEITNLGIKKALELAYQQNPQLRQLEARIDAQKQQEILGLGLRDPRISYFREGIGDGTFSEQRWSVSQQLEFPLTSYYRLKSEQASTNALQLRMQGLQLQLKSDVKKAYTNLAYALQNVRLAEERVQLFRNLRRAAQARADIGESSEIDAMQASLQLNEAQNNLGMAKQVIMEARYELFQTIGLDPEVQSYGITFPDTLQYVEVNVDQEEVLNKLPAHPKLQQIAGQQKSARYQTKVAKSSYLPDLNFSYYRQDFGGNYDFYGFEVGISLPLWFGANQARQVEQSRAVYNEIGSQYHERELALKREAEQAWHGYLNSRINILRFRNTIRAESIELVRMTQQGYRMGELDLLTLLEAQRTYLRTQEAYYQTLRDYYLRIIELEQYLQTDLVFK